MYKLNKTSPFQVEIQLQDPRETGSFFRTNERSSSLPAILVSVISVIRASRALISRVPLDLEGLEGDDQCRSPPDHSPPFPPRYSFLLAQFPHFPFIPAPSAGRMHHLLHSVPGKTSPGRPILHPRLRETETELDEARGFGTEGFIVSLV